VTKTARINRNRIAKEKGAHSSYAKYYHNPQKARNLLDASPKKLGCTQEGRKGAVQLFKWDAIIET